MRAAVMRDSKLIVDDIESPKPGAGEVLGVNPDTLRYRMRKLGIPFGKKKR